MFLLQKSRADNRIFESCLCFVSSLLINHLCFEPVLFLVLYTVQDTETVTCLCSSR